MRLVDKLRQTAHIRRRLRTTQNSVSLTALICSPSMTLMVMEFSVKVIQSLSMVMSLPMAIILVSSQSKHLPLKMAAAVWLLHLLCLQHRLRMLVNVRTTTQALTDGPVMFGTMRMVLSMIVRGILRALAAHHLEIPMPTLAGLPIPPVVHVEVAAANKGVL